MEDLVIEILKLFIATFLGGLATFILSRVTKTKDDRYQQIVSVMEGFARIADMSADQLVDKIKMVDDLEKKYTELKTLYFKMDRELKAERNYVAMLQVQLVEEAGLKPKNRPVVPDSDTPRKV